MADAHWSIVGIARWPKSWHETWTTDTATALVYAQDQAETDRTPPVVVRSTIHIRTVDLQSERDELRRQVHALAAALVGSGSMRRYGSGSGYPELTLRARSRQAPPA